MLRGGSVLVGWCACAGVALGEDPFYVPADPQFSIVDSMHASVRFTTQRCLVPEGQGLRANSTFVDPEGKPALWHELGALEGVGWAANAVGGAIHLVRYARFFGDRDVEQKGLKVLHHAVYGGFIDEKTGALRPYRDLTNGRYYLNYLHDDKHNDWFCAGSAAKVALQYIWAAELCPETKLGEDGKACGLRLAGWLRDNVKLAPNGWFPRRSYPDGRPFPYDAHGKDPDKQFDRSGDGLYLLWLFAEMAHRNHPEYRPLIERPLKAFVAAGGFFGSMNHDTYDDDENVCRAVAFRVLTRIADWGLCDDPEAVRKVAYDKCLKGLERFEMREDRNGVATKGLLYMEDSWDTAYLWENAEASLAYLEAARLAGNRPEFLSKGVTILRAAAKHHYGPYGFLTEGVDWNNHNQQWREVNGKKIPIHVGGVVYGAVNYTQPFLNNLHIVEPTLFYLNHFAKRVTEGNEQRLLDHEGNIIWRGRPAPTTAGS